MCAYSAILDNVVRPYSPMFSGPITGVPLPDYASRTELEVMRRQFEREMDELRKLLPHVKKYDEATGQPDCESDEKLRLLRAIGEKLGVDVGDIG